MSSNESTSTALDPSTVELVLQQLRAACHDDITGRVLDQPDLGMGLVAVAACRAAFAALGYKPWALIDELQGFVTPLARAMGSDVSAQAGLIRSIRAGVTDTADADDRRADVLVMISRLEPSDTMVCCMNKLAEMACWANLPAAVDRDLQEGQFFETAMATLMLDVALLLAEDVGEHAVRDLIGDLRAVAGGRHAA